MTEAQRGTITHNVQGVSLTGEKQSIYPECFFNFRIDGNEYANTFRYADWTFTPEPKPWHAAKHNEIWVLFVAISEEAYRVDGDAFVPVNNPSRIRIRVTDPRIQKAHRIYPEDA